jgi:SHS2 domain-containing protein
MTDRRSASRGHRLVDHTADVIVEAFGPDLESCLEEAVAGLVDVYLSEDAGRTGVTTRAFDLGEGDDVMWRLLGEVVYLLDTSGYAPVGATVEHGPGGFTAVVRLGELDSEWGTGAVPKAISRSGYRIETRGGAVRCRFLVDV